MDTFLDEQPPQVNASRAITNSPAFEPAPTINIHNNYYVIPQRPLNSSGLTRLGYRHIRALLEHLHEHPDNLLPSDVTPKAVNGTKMHPMGKMPVTLSLGALQYTNDFYIYPEVTGTLLSWKAAKGLNIITQKLPSSSQSFSGSRQHYQQ